MKIIAGGQTGVDRAALDVALALARPCGGWCPRGRLAEDGPLPPVYPLQETPTDGPAERTAWNVRDADGTLVLTAGDPDPGTDLTLRLAHQLGKPVYQVDLRSPAPLPAIHAWLTTHGIRTLNVAGPRESAQPGIYTLAAGLLFDLLTLCPPDPVQ